MVSSTPSLETSLDLNDSGSSRISPSRLPRMLVEYQPSTPEHPGLEARGQDRLHQGLAGLEVLAGDRHLVRPRPARAGPGCRGCRLGAPLAMRDALLQQGVGVDLAGGDVGVRSRAGPARTPRGWRARRWARGTPRWSRTTPRPGGRSRSPRLKRWMSSTSCSARSHLDVPGLDVVAVQVLDVVLLEHGGHGLDGPQLLAELLEQVRRRARRRGWRPRRRRRGRRPSRRTPGRRGRPGARSP